MNVLHLLVREEESCSADYTMDGVDLIHYNKVRVGVVVLDCIYNTSKHLVVHLIVTSLLQLEVLDAAKELE